jgi:dipeptidyl aminopeptidase/acylaminoacyl peptidase
LNGQKISEFNHAGNSGLNLSVAPDGSAFLFAYLDFSDEMPAEWRESAFIQLRNGGGMLRALQPVFLYDLKTGKCSMPLNTPWVASTPLWAADGKSFAVTALAPVGTKFEEDDKRDHILGHVSKSHLYVVNVRNSTAELVAPQQAFPWEGPLYWALSGELFLRASALDRIEEFAHRDGKWQEVDSIRLPFKGDLQATTNGSYVVGAFSDSETPPEMFLYERSAKKVQILDRFNPQFDHLTLARQQVVHWKTSRGFDATGIVLIPPDYVSGKRYPLVIQTKPFADGFACSFGNFPSFAPQPIANSGIMYIGRLDTDGSEQKEEDYYPDGYPGQRETGTISEAAFNMDLWESAIQTLDKMGLIDPAKVGIIGFSRTGWYTEFLLAHSHNHFRAATVADNVQYSVGEYWLRHDRETIDEYNHLYGGPPEGASAQNWQNYSITFNLDKISTPLLMEEMGDGKAYEDVNMVPIDLAAAFEVFTGLSVLKRPVELFYYPEEDHTPDHPQARLSTLQRNVDWYRFWLQGYERPNPEDPDQYHRWLRLCADTHSCAK